MGILIFLLSVCRRSATPDLRKAAVAGQPVAAVAHQVKWRTDIAVTEGVIA
ncbi:hypothetical protein JHU04_001383 [Brenneria sp. 4F2]|nr:hypothetical protein [Brenneria bubanii]